MSDRRPLLSVIIPAHQAARSLPATLAALEASDLPRALWELLVADDASTDATEIVAAQHADTVVRLAGNPHGPAYARNRASEFSRGDVLVFVDADVCVHPDALRRIAAEFAARPELGAVFGSYDDHPAAPDLISQYRNLLQHYIHHESAGEAETFWAGLGAVRADVFAEACKFDEWHYSQPSIEDIELGLRIRRLGHRIVLRPEIQGTHLKRWTLADVLRSDYRHRGVPWAWLRIREGPSETAPGLNVRLEYRISTALACLAAVALVATPFLGVRTAAVIFAALAAAVALLNVRFYGLLARRLGAARTLAIFPAHLFQYISNGVALISGWVHHHMVEVPATPASVAAVAALGMKTWPPPHARPRSSVWAAQQNSPQDPRDPLPEEPSP